MIRVIWSRDARDVMAMTPLSGRVFMSFPWVVDVGTILFLCRFADSRYITGICKILPNVYLNTNTKYFDRNACNYKFNKF